MDQKHFFTPIILDDMCLAARILRGLRFASRLGMSFTNDAEAAIRNLSSSILNLDKVVLIRFSYLTFNSNKICTECLNKKISFSW